MQKATFELSCPSPEIVIQAIQFNDHNNVTYELLDGKIRLTFTASDIKDLVKATYSVCSKLQLSIDTIKRFKIE